MNSIIPVVLLCIIPFLCPVLLIPIEQLKLCENNKNTKLWSIALAYSIAIIGYCCNYASGANADMTRHAVQLGRVASSGSVWNYLESLGETNTFVYYYYLKFVSLFGDDFRILSFISVFITMLLMFRIIRISMNEAESTSISNITTLLFSCLAINFLVFCCSFRQVMAFMIYINLFLTETNQDTSKIKKYMCYLAYGILVFYHTSILIMVILRIFSQLFKKKPTLLAVFLLVWAMLWEKIRSFLVAIGGSYSDTLVTFMDYYKDYSGTTPLMYIIWGFHIGLLIYLLLYMRKYMSEYVDNHNSYYSFSWCVAAFAIGSFNSYTLFNRMSMMCWALSIYLLPSIAENMLYEHRRKFPVIAINASTLLAFAYYCVSIYFASDSGVSWNVIELVTTNIISILIGK